MMGNGQMPGMNVPPQQTQPTNSLTGQNLNDFNRAEKLKTESATLVKNSKFNEACEKYFQAINIVRLNEELKYTKEAKQLEIACRANIAHCKLQLNEYQIVIDQCEKVLEMDPSNAKSKMRMETAIWKKSDTHSDSEVKSAFKLLTEA